MKNNRIYKLFVITNCIVIVACLAACSSPESDGRKAAEKKCDCVNDYAEKLNKTYTAFIDKFDSYSFKTRVEAREKLDEQVHKVEAEFEKCNQEADLYYNKISGKYLSKREKAEKFQYAYTAQNRAFNAPSFDAQAFQTNIDRQIQTIIPPKPAEAKIKKDLVGHSLYKPDNFARKKFNFDKESEIAAVTIQSAKEVNNEIVYDVHLDLQTEINQYVAEVKITYHLFQKDDWTIEHIETIDYQVVPTNKYKNCITVTKKTNGWSDYLYFQNNCDVALLIEGTCHHSYGSGYGWEEFAIEVPGNFETLFDFDTKLDYKIRQIERP